jgi:lipopolysaccharide export system protein LptA
MHRFLTVFALAFPAMHLAGKAQEEPPAGLRVPAISMLPDGSELQGVMLPRYDRDHNLIGVLKARALTLVSAGQVASHAVSIELFNPDKSRQALIDLTHAYLYQEKGVIVANERVTIQSERLTAKGNGLYYSYTGAKGFLLGPTTTTITHPPDRKTTMKSPASSLRAATLGLALATQPAAATTPASAGQIERTDLRATLKASDETNKAVAAFLEEADLLAEAPPTPPVDEKPAPLEVKPDPERTLIHARGGNYLDANKRVLVYLKDVTVTHPDFDLTADIDIKVFLEEKPPTETQAGDKKLGVTDPGFGDVERIVATGAVHLRQKNPKKGEAPLEARGAIFSYNVKTGQIVISGGYPWFIRGDDYHRAMEPNLSLHIDKDFNIKTEGHWETGIHHLDLKKKKKK